MGTGKANRCFTRSNYASGVHVLAILKDEQFEQAVDDDYLLEEWLQVRSQINADAVHLWRGK